MSFLLRYACGTLERNALKIELKYGALVGYVSRCRVRSTQILNVLCGIAILGRDQNVRIQSVCKVYFNIHASIFSSITPHYRPAYLVPQRSLIQKTLLFNFLACFSILVM